MLDTQSILDVLKPVQDPELQKSLVELNMIRNVAVEGGNVSFTLVLTTPACPLREFIVEDCKKMNIKSIEFTGGGEPTVHPDHVEIFNKVHELGIDAGLITNGALFRKGFVDSVLKFSCTMKGRSEALTC